VLSHQHSGSSNQDKLVKLLLFSSPNNNLFHAHKHTETVAAVVDGTTGPGTTSKQLLKLPALNTHTAMLPWTTVLLPSATLFQLQVVLFTLQALLTKLSELLVWTFKPPLPNNPSQSLLKLTNQFSNNTPVVSSPAPHAEQPLITPFSLSAMEPPQPARITGSFKTRGQTLGVIKASFWLVLHPIQVFAVLTRWYTTHSQLTHDEAEILSL